ncbi:DUF4142 domain-containing protein [Caballeronia sp. Lep1P3]|uniref:DUF4142 domain-containing protein n=1 Tax=Caballeronia sp. Lep1P3 TaxID=2878150 RepID=UPI001FD418F8|nr:DUF4142 domain-containing protein [Caballeronia sp. Lep1P3]
MKLASHAVALALLVAKSLCAHAQDGPLTGAQVVGVVIVANRSDVAVGELALRRTQSRSVQNFARRLVAEHGDAERRAAAMLAQFGAQARASAMSDALANQARGDLDTLDELGSRDFDLAYVRREIVWHERWIAATDDIIRSTTNPHVKALLAAARPTCILHLNQARTLEWALSR